MSELHSLFPINLTANWQSKPVQQLSPLLFDWLNDPNSLTARLKTNCETFRVEVLGQQIESCSLKESNTVINEGDRVLVREVLLYCDEIPQVYARSLRSPLDSNLSFFDATLNPIQSNDDRGGPDSGFKVT
ncbi:MAG: hypothetical protein DRQ47_07465, partial [Gammaproteobacteria bacterium]